MDLRSTDMQSKTIITIGFTAIVVMLMVLLGVWVNNVHNNEIILNNIADAQLETRQITIMRNAAYRRALALHRMSIMPDPFDLEEEERRFRELGGIFMSMREKVLSRPMQQDEKLAWDHVRDILNKGGESQNQVLDLILDEQLDRANTILLDEVVPLQDIFVKSISDILDDQRSAVESKIAEVTRRNHTTYWLIGLFASVAMVLGVFTIFVVRRTGKTESALINQGKRIRELYEVSSMQGLAIDEQVSEMLKLGCRMLNLEMAKVCKIDIQKNTNTFLYTHAPESYALKPGIELPLDKTFCSVTFSSDNAIAINNISESTHVNSPYHEFSQLESYIAANISVRGTKFGTVNFSSRLPHRNVFTDTDKDLVNLIGSWLGLSLERQMSQEELYTAKDNAEAANKTKSAFLANMSHELRTPLNAIIGYSELMIEDLIDAAEKRQLPDLKNISSSGHHLLRLINDILDISKIEAGKMELNLEETSITELINNTIENFRPDLQKKGLKLIVNNSPDLGISVVDPMRLTQALMNLCSNALKFTDNGTITINADHERHEGITWTVIHVADTGIGIDKNDIDNIFIPFQQSSSGVNSQYGGTGLGLAISRRICRLMGGDISVQSHLNQGSTFSIWLPIENSGNRLRNGN
ncbi:MAG: GAF domain-containing sensor histidine kinase [Ectothiorhodospiraceae bacterium]|nr:GAF domain-containing sensor histidine kinase [Ectothiorhodospiraceae bacterium]